MGGTKYAGAVAAESDVRVIGITKVLHRRALEGLDGEIARNGSVRHDVHRVVESRVVARASYSIAEIERANNVSRSAALQIYRLRNARLGISDSKLSHRLSNEVISEKLKQ